MQASIIICTRNPRGDYLKATLRALKAQTLPKNDWELLLVDSASNLELSQSWDISWHPEGRHLREEEPGLTPARLRGIRESKGDLLIFVDDDNILAPDYLEHALAIATNYPHIGVFGSGDISPFFEAEPDSKVREVMGMLALRKVSCALWTNNPLDYSAIPYGAGLCVPRKIAARYVLLVSQLRTVGVLGRRGTHLYCGEDDLFSRFSATRLTAFGIFPELRITHHISRSRVQPDYLLRLKHDHAFSHSVLRFMLDGIMPKGAVMMPLCKALVHGLRGGLFSLRCRIAEDKGIYDAFLYIKANRLEPLAPAQLASVNTEPHPTGA